MGTSLELLGNVCNDRAMKDSKTFSISLVALSTLMLLLFMVAGIFFTAQLSTNVQAENDEQKTSPVPVTSEVDVDLPEQELFPQLQAPDVLARNAVIIDFLDGKVIYEKNASTAVPMASITKLFVAYYASKFLEPTDTISISTSATQIDGNFYPGESFQFKDALEYGLAVSSNALFVSIAEAAGRKIQPTNNDPENVFLQYVEKELKKINITSPTFINASGLDENNSAKNVATAKDIALFFRVVLEDKPSIIEKTTKKYYDIMSSNGVVREGKNTNSIVYSLPGLRGGKTGYTDIAGGNLGIVVSPSPNETYGVVVLGSTVSERFTDITALSDYLVKRSSL